MNRERQAELKAAVQELPSQAGIDLSNWNWKAVRRLVEDVKDGEKMYRVGGPIADSGG